MTTHTLCAPGLIGATTQPAGDGSTMLTWLILLAAISIVPFVLTMITSFAKLVIVGGILRQALGTQQVPPNTVITGLALILTIHIMWPVGWSAYRAYEAAGGTFTNEAMTRAAAPFRKFLTDHSSPGNRELFAGLQSQLRGPSEDQPPETPEVKPWLELATVEVPAFVLTELSQAFQIGFLLFVPFVIIDLVVSNILISMGMSMLTPTTISLPLKFLLFVLVDGWRLLMQGLVSGYVPAAH